MTTIETKIAKNGTKMYYVRENSKLVRISRDKADEIEAANTEEQLNTARTNGLTLEEFFASLKGLSLAEYTEQKEQAERDAQKRDAVYAVQSKIDSLQSNINFYSEKSLKAANFLHKAVADNDTLNAESIAADIADYETQLATAKVELATAKVELASLRPAEENATVKETANVIVKTETLPAESTLPKGNVTVNTGAEAWATIAPYFPNGLHFAKAGKGYNDEDTFSYTYNDTLYATATCTPDNSRIECVEVINTNESGSARRVLSVTIAEPIACSCMQAALEEHDINDADNESEESAPATVDEFPAKLAALDADVARAEKDRDVAKAAFETAETAAQNAKSVRQIYLDSVAVKLTEKLYDACRYYDSIETERGCHYIIGDTMDIHIAPTLDGKFAFVTWNNREFACYDTPAQVETVIARLKIAIANGATEFAFPTVEELNAPPEPTPDTIAEAAKICESVNTVAPSGWEVSFDSESKSFPVTFNGDIVTRLDSLALSKALPPEKFFDQFKPLVDADYTPRQQFIDDRYRELHELQAMREELGDDSDRAKTLDGLINRLKRDILNAELEPDEPPETRDVVEYDEHGNITNIWF